MNDEVKAALKQVEFILNQLAAEQAALRTSLQVLILNSVAAHPQRLSAVQQMKRETIGSLTASGAEGDDAELARLSLQMRLASAERMFGAMEEFIRQSPPAAKRG